MFNVGKMKLQPQRSKLPIGGNRNQKLSLIKPESREERQKDRASLAGVLKGNDPKNEGLLTKIKGIACKVYEFFTDDKSIEEDDSD